MARIGIGLSRFFVCAAAAVAIAAPAAAQKVNIVEAGAAVFRLPVYVAIQNGYFKAEGIDLNMVETRSGSDGMKMLAGKATEFAVGQLLDAALLNKQGINVRGVAMLTNRFTNSILVRKDLAAEIKSMKDVKGREIGVTGVGSGTWQFALFVAAQEGLKVGDLNIVGVGTGANVIGAIKGKRVAVMSYAEPETLQLVNDGDAAFLIDGGDPATHRRIIGEDYMNNWIMVMDDYAKGNGKTIQSFVNAIQSALNWLDGRSPEAITDLLLAFPGFTGQDRNIMIASVKRAGLAKTAEVTRSAYANAMKMPLGAGAIDSAVPFETLVDNTFALAAAKTHPPK